MSCRRSLLVPALLVPTAACVPLTKAELMPRARLQDVQARATRREDGRWTICLSLPNPSRNVPWEVAPEEGEAIVRQEVEGRSEWAWILPVARWRNRAPFKVRIQAPGLDEVVQLDHPTGEQTLSKGAQVVLEILTLPLRVAPWF